MGNHRTMDLEQFVNLVRQGEDAKKLEITTLELLYKSMTTTEIKLSHDVTMNCVISISSWNLLIKRAQKENEPKSNCNDLMSLNSKNKRCGYIDCLKMDT